MNAFALEPDCASGLVTVTVTAPATRAFVVHVNDVALCRLTEEHSVPPNDTVGVPVKPVPVTVTLVPPAAGPEAGATESTVGADATTFQVWLAGVASTLA